jgi:glutathione S-transferase
MSTLHGAALSPFVRKVRIALKEKGLTYDHDPVVPFNLSDEFKKRARSGRSPSIRRSRGCTSPIRR